MHAERANSPSLQAELVRTAVLGLHIKKLPCSPHHITEVRSASAPLGANKNVTS